MSMMSPDSIMEAPFKIVDFGDPSAEITRRLNGEIIIRPQEPLNADAVPRQMGEYLRANAQKMPSRTFMAERDGHGQWCELTYGQALEQVNCISQALIDHGHRPERPIAALSENSLNLAVLILAAMQVVGIPVIPLSPAYALMSRGYTKLNYLMSLARPSLIYVPSLEPFMPPLEVLDLRNVEILTDDPSPDMVGSVGLEVMSASI